MMMIFVIFRIKGEIKYVYSFLLALFVIFMISSKVLVLFSYIRLCTLMCYVLP